MAGCVHARRRVLGIRWRRVPRGWAAPKRRQHTPDGQDGYRHPSPRLQSPAPNHTGIVCTPGCHWSVEGLWGSQATSQNLFPRLMWTRGPRLSEKEAFTLRPLQTPTASTCVHTCPPPPGSLDIPSGLELQTHGRKKDFGGSRFTVTTLRPKQSPALYPPGRVGRWEGQPSGEGL